MATAFSSTSSSSSSSSSSIVHIHPRANKVEAHSVPVTIPGTNLLQSSLVRSGPIDAVADSAEHGLSAGIPIDEESKLSSPNSSPTKSASRLSPKTLYAMCTDTNGVDPNLSESVNDSKIRRKIIRHFRFKSIDSQHANHTRRESTGATVHYTPPKAQPNAAKDEENNETVNRTETVDESTARRRHLAESMREIHENVLGTIQIEEIMLALSINGDDAEKAFNWINESALE